MKIRVLRLALISGLVIWVATLVPGLQLVSFWGILGVVVVIGLLCLWLDVFSRHSEQPLRFAGALGPRHSLPGTRLGHLPLRGIRGFEGIHEGENPSHPQTSRQKSVFLHSYSHEGFTRR